MMNEAIGQKERLLAELIGLQSALGRSDSCD